MDFLIRFISMRSCYRLKAKPDELIEMFDLEVNAHPQPIDSEYFPVKSVPVMR